WVLTIATRVAIDTHRRAGEPTDELPDLAHSDGRPAYEELAFLTDTLPSKERAAVVLGYGYDLDYEQIAAALDSSAEAARQATSSGVRRLRRRITCPFRPTSIGVSARPPRAPSCSTGPTT